MILRQEPEYNDDSVLTNSSKCTATKRIRPLLFSVFDECIQEVQEFKDSIYLVGHVTVKAGTSDQCI